MHSPTVKSIFPVAVCAVILVFSVLAHATELHAILTANSPSYTFSPAITSSGNGGTVGWAFQVAAGTNLSVDYLGLYDPGDVALLSSHPVELWDSNQNLLAQVTIPSGVGANYLSGYTYQALSNSVTLNAGNTYYVGAYYPAGCGDKILVTGTTQQFDTNITFLNGQQTLFSPSQTNIAFPNIANSITGTYKQGWFGPTFQFTAIPLPEPSTNALLILSLVVLIVVSLWSRGQHVLELFHLG